MTALKFVKSTEVQYLRDALERFVDTDSDWIKTESGQKIQAKQLEKLRVLQSVGAEKEYQNDYRLFSATLNYGATGEGETLIFMAEGAPNMGEFLVKVCTTISGYYAIGVDLYDGLPPKTDRVFEYLVSKPMQRMLADQVKAGNWASAQILIEQHRG